MAASKRGEAGSYIVSATLPKARRHVIHRAGVGDKSVEPRLGVCLDFLSIAGIVCLIIGLVRRFSS